MRRRIAARLALGAFPRHWLLALAIVTAACRSGPPPPMQVTSRLVDHLDPQAPDLVGHDCAPFDERRPALGCTPWNVRYSRPAKLPPRIDWFATLPADRGRPLLLRADLLLAGPWQMTKPIGDPWIEPPSDALRPDFARLIPADAPAGSRARIAIRGALPADVVTAPIEVPRGAVLSVGLALDEAAPRDGLDGVEFVITGERAGERHELLRAVVPATAKAWDDRRVPLDAVAGSATRFHFVTRVIPQPGANARRVTAVPLWGAPEVLAPAADDTPPNVILVSLDTLRADHVGAYGETRKLTPRIDALAAEGTVFEHAFTTYPSTTYAHLSMLSGLYPRHIGPVFLSRAVPDGVHMLAQHLGRAGWATGAVTEDVMLAAATGFPRGFSTYAENQDREIFDSESRKFEKTMGAALGWLERHAADRVFLFIHSYVVHWPYSAPAEFRFATFKDGDVERPMSEAQGVQWMRWAYAAEVRYADTQIGRLMDTLQRLGIASRTIVIVTSDHGEEFDEHGKWSHSHSVYDELLHVPLVLWAPGRLPAGKRIRTATSLTDVLPTVLDLVGLPPAERIDGESQVPRIRGTAPEDPDRVVFAEVHPGNRNPYHMVAAHTLAEKWIFTDIEPPKIVAYDLVADPGEHAPLDDPARVDRGRRYVARYDAFGQDEGGAVVDAPVDPAMHDRLKALGYVQ